jgi:hypothetical protein
MRRRAPLALVALALVALAGAPAGADHTDPNSPIVPIVQRPDEARTFGEGTWEHIANFGGVGLTGTDVKFFHRNGATYMTGGQLGQTQATSVGQRVLQLTDEAGNVDPKFVADHGSAYCPDPTNASATTGLQHDAAVTPRVYGSDFFSDAVAKPDAELIIDNTDAVGRCHDSPVGGWELVDITGLGEDGFEPREVHLTRFTGYSHTVTADATRPWIIYNSTSDFGADPTNDENPLGIGKAWIDIADIRTCLGLEGKTLEEKRAACRPKVFRLPFEYAWAVQETAEEERKQPSACHDITARPGKIYCAALNATLVFDVSGLTTAQGPDIPAATDPAGDIKGTPLACEVKDAVPARGTSATGAKVTDCTLGVANDTGPAVQAWIDAGRPQATGWRYLGHVNHVGRECGTNNNGLPSNQYACNTNTKTPSDEGLAVSHESDPTPDGKHMFVTDERGGGIIPPGAACVPTVDNPYGNGGLHVFDLTKKDDQGRFQYAENQDGGKAIYITPANTPTATFCTIHVIEQIPDEQRIIAAWYSQGVKILDYFIDDQGRFAFQETAGYAYQPNDIWVGEVFKIKDNEDGTRTYWFASNDIIRGVDVFSWTGPTNKFASAPQTPPRPQPRPTVPPRPKPTTPLPSTGADFAVLGAAALLLPLALVVRRRRLATTR